MSAHSPDALTAAVLALPPAELWQHFDRLSGRPEVAASGWHLAEQRLSPRPNASRDAEWLRLHDDGLSYADIALAFGVARSTVAKAIQRERHRRVDTKSLSTDCGRYAS
jgi:DNA-directed RNA polymerase specialized sigma24 family protein